METGRRDSRLVSRDYVSGLNSNVTVSVGKEINGILNERVNEFIRQQSTNSTEHNKQRCC